MDLFGGRIRVGRRPEAIPDGPAFGAAAALAVGAHDTPTGALSGGPSSGAIVAAAAPMADGGPTGIPKMPGKRTVDPRAKQARFFARRIGFVNKTYRFLAHQAARPPLWIERSVDGGSTWDMVPPELDPWGYGILRSIKPPTGATADIIRPAVFLDDTAGEFYLIDVTTNPQEPAWIIRDVDAVKYVKQRKVYIVRNSPDARMSDGAAAIFEVPEAKVYRHYQEDPNWPLMATSSLMPLVDDLDTLWNLERQLRRETLSRLSMNNILWSPSEAHAKTVLVGGQEVSLFDLGFAQAATAKLNDHDDEDVASAAPYGINTPGQGPTGTTMPVPKIIEVPSLKEDLLKYIVDRRKLAAAGLPLSSSAILEANDQSENHWSEWLSDEQDLQTIGERLRRVLDTFTDIIFRPALRIGQTYGVWRGGDPAMYRIGYDAETLRRTLDNSDNAIYAWENFLVTDEAARRYLRLKEGEAPTPEQFAEMIERRKQITAATTPAAPEGPGGPAAGPAALPAGSDPAKAIAALPPMPQLGNPSAPKELPAGGAVPNGGQPPASKMASAPTDEITDRAAAGLIAQALTAVDDSWLVSGD